MLDQAKIIVGVGIGLYVVATTGVAIGSSYFWYESHKTLEECKKEKKEISDAKLAAQQTVDDLQKANDKLYKDGIESDKRRKAAEAKNAPLLAQNQDFIRQLEATPKGGDNCERANLVANQFIDYVEQLRKQSPKAGTRNNSDSKGLHKGVTDTPRFENVFYEEGRNG